MEVSLYPVGEWVMEVSLYPVGEGVEVSLYPVGEGEGSIPLSSG